MIYKRTYKAFTLWEVMIAMVITSLIVTLSYGAYGRFAKLLKEDQENLDDMHEMVFLERDLFRLTNSCESIEMIDDILYFNKKDTYSFIEFMDSTMILTEDNWGKEREYQIADWSVKYLDDHSDYIKSFQIRYDFNHHHYNFCLKKIYTRSVLYSMIK